MDDAREYAVERLRTCAIVVKPADSSGSKGVSKVIDKSTFNKAYEVANEYSISKIVVIEDFIEKAIYEMDGDGFVWEGKLAFACFGNQHNDLKPFHTTKWYDSASIFYIPQATFGERIKPGSFQLTARTGSAITTTKEIIAPIINKETK